MVSRLLDALHLVRVAQKSVQIPVLPPQVVHENLPCLFDTDLLLVEHDIYDGLFHIIDKNPFFPSCALVAPRPCLSSA